MIVTLADYAAYRKLSLPDVPADEQARITGLLERAQARVEIHCQRRFEPVAGTRYYDAVGPHLQGRMLLLDTDLLAVTTLTNGDGKEIAAGDYRLYPLNGNPKFAIVLKASAGVYWTWQDDPEAAIVVEGSWGYDTAVPGDVEQAVLQLTDWYYKLSSQSPSEIGETRRLADGTMILPSRLPADIRALLDPYVRISVGAI